MRGRAARHRHVAGAGPRRPAALSLADTILADTAASSLHPSGRLLATQPDDYPGSTRRCCCRPCAAPCRPTTRAPRPRSTPSAASSAEDGFVYRFRHDERALGDAEGAFLLCGFMMALAEHQLGHADCAMRWFERNRAACGPPGLFCEEYDVKQRQLRGNLPQAFAHALMLECAATLAD